MLYKLWNIKKKRTCVDEWIRIGRMKEKAGMWRQLNSSSIQYLNEKCVHIKFTFIIKTHIAV